MSISWIPQPFESRDPCKCEIKLTIPSAPFGLAKLREDLRTHLRRPLSELADGPFLGSYELGAGSAVVTLDFQHVPDALIKMTTAGGGLVATRYRSALDSFEVSMPFDITVLDRFCAQLGDLPL